MGKNDYLELTPTLFVGLGGTGKMVLSEIKRLFMEHPFFERRIPGMIDFLSIDSDADVDTYKDEDEALKALNKEETLLVRAQVGDIKAHLDRKPHIKSWFPVAHTRNVELTGRGAKQKRYLGRLSFFSSIEEILETVRGKFTRICSRSNIVTEGRVRMSDSGNADVYIVNSLCGGTGSGMFVDLAYVLREVALETASKRLAVTGMFLTSEAFHLPGFRDNIQRNCASALMELDYYMSPRHNDFTTKYTDNFQVKNSKAAKAFDFAYIVNGTEIEDHVLVERTIAHGIFSGVITSAGRKKDSVKDNIVYDAIEKNEQKYTSFSTYGFGSLYFPREELSGIFALRFAQALLGNITQKWDKSNKRLQSRLTTFMSSSLPELSRVPAEVMLDRILTLREFQTVAPPQKNLDASEFSRGEAGGRVKNWVKSQLVTETQQKRLLERSGANLKNWCDSILDAVDKEVSNQIGDFDLGVAFAFRFAEMFQQMVEEYTGAWEQELESLNENISRNDARVAQQLKKIDEISSSVFSFFRKEDLQSAIDTVRSLQAKSNKMIFDHNRLDQAVLGMKQVQKDLDSLFRQVLKNQCAALEEMRTKNFPAAETNELRKLYERKRKNQFVDRIVTEEDDMNAGSWYYDRILYGSCGLSEEQIGERFDKFEADFIKEADLGGKWRVYATSPFDFERRLKEFGAQRFSAILGLSIEDFLREKAEWRCGNDAARKKAFFVELLKSLFTASRPTTATSDKRGRYNSVFTMTFGVPDDEHTLFDRQLTEEAFTVKNAKTNVAGIGFPHRVILIQTEEAVPITAVNGVEAWAQAYKTSDRYLHAIGEESGIDWNNHLLVKDSFSLNIRSAVLHLFLGLHLGVVRKRTPKSGEETVYYVHEDTTDDVFATGASGINLGNSIEESIRELCDKSDKLIGLEHRIKKDSNFHTLNDEAVAAVLKDYMAKLAKALERVENEEMRKAYTVINKALLSNYKVYTSRSQQRADEKELEGELEV
ncbi:MAG: tubulin-like doman-containing protein [Candidatus Wallbacteria bacterium]|nr:tubulin-like doman-containing protein [Candidatus Wallbacteria bacterium]